MILEVAVKNRIEKNKMPSKMVIFSDMQFDIACNNYETDYRRIKKIYKTYNYDVPHIIFWNLRGDTNGYVNKSDESYTTVLSGFGPCSFKNF